MRFNFLRYLTKVNISLFILILFMALMNRINFGMRLVSLSAITKFFSLSFLLWVLLKLRDLSFNPDAIKKYLQGRAIIISAIFRKYQLSLKFKRLVDWLLIPLVLAVLGLGLFLSNVLHQEESFSVLVQEQNKSVSFSGDTDEILAGEKIDGGFQAIENNLGIVALRFNTFNRINDDILIFRIKEKGQDDWYYGNEYKVDQFQPDDFFPFGFPKIPDSKDKIYHFQIESTQGIPGDAVSLSEYFLIFKAKYEFSKAKILSSKEEMLSFAYKKLSNLVSNRDFAASSIIFFFPLIIYFIWMLLARRYFTHSYILIYFVLLAVLFDSLLIHKVNDYITLLLICLWFFVAGIYKVKYKVAVFASLFFLFVSALLLLINQEIVAAKAANWIFFFLVITMIQRGLDYLMKGAKSEKVKQK